MKFDKNYIGKRVVFDEDERGTIIDVSDETVYVRIDEVFLVDAYDVGLREIRNEEVALEQ